MTLGTRKYHIHADVTKVPLAYISATRHSYAKVREHSDIMRVNRRHSLPKLPPDLIGDRGCALHA